METGGKVSGIRTVEAAGEMKILGAMRRWIRPAGEGNQKKNRCGMRERKKKRCGMRGRKRKR